MQITRSPIARYPITKRKQTPFENHGSAANGYEKYRSHERWILRTARDTRRKNKMASANEIGSTSDLTRTCTHEGGFDYTGHPTAPSTLALEVLQSGAGHYLGHMCPHCGPFDRVSGYYISHDEATGALAVTLAGSHDEFRSTAYHPDTLEFTFLDFPE